MLSTQRIMPTSSLTLYVMIKWKGTWLLLLVLVAAAHRAGAPAPVVNWHATPVHPNSTAMLAGDGLGGTTSVRVCVSPRPTGLGTPPTSCVDARPLRAGAQSLSFVIPAAWPLATYRYALGGAATGVLNAAEPW